MAPPIPKTVLGLDFAPDRLAVAELRRRGNKCEIIRSALFPRTFESGASLREALKERGFKAKYTAVAPPAEGTLFRHMFLPSNMQRNIRPFLWTVINHEAPAEAAFDWINLGTPSAAPAHNLYLVAIVRAIALIRAEDLIKKAGLQPVLSTPRNIGFFHLARTLGLAEENQPILLVDRREDRVDLTIARGKQLLYCRGQVAARALPTRGGARVGGAEAVARQLETALHHAREQIKEPDLTPAAVYVSGSGAAALAEELSELTGYETSTLDPFKTLDSGESETAQGLDSEECVGAVGIALAALRRNRDSSIALSIGRPKAIALDRDLRYYRTAVAVAVLAMILVVFGNVHARGVTKRNALLVKGQADTAASNEASLKRRVTELSKASVELVKIATAAAAVEPLAAVLKELSRILPSDFRIEDFQIIPDDARRNRLVFDQGLRIDVVISLPQDTLGAEKYDEIVAVAESLRSSEVLLALKYRPINEPLKDQRFVGASARPRWRFSFRIERQSS